MGNADPIVISLDSIKSRMEARLKQETAEEEQKRKEDVEKQMQEGKCKLIPFPTCATQPFRSELTIERHPLFVVNAFKGDCFVHERTVEHPQTREPVIQRIMVGTLEKKSTRTYGVLKQVHQGLFYKLLKLWGEQGYPLDGSRGAVSTTVYDLVVALRGDDAAHHYQRTRRLLRDLSSIPIVFENAYTWQGLQDLDEFTLLADVKWNVRKLDKETLRPRQGGSSKVKITFSETVTEGFLRKNVKQLLWNPYAELGGQGRGRRAEIARLLYPLLDHELSTKDQYHIRLTTLSERLGLASHAYKSLRVRPFIQAIKLLHGKPILGEKYKLQMKLTESADGEDFILEARRAAYQLKLQGV